MKGRDPEIVNKQICEQKLYRTYLFGGKIGNNSKCLFFTDTGDYSRPALRLTAILADVVTDFIGAQPKSESNDDGFDSKRD
jgi:hypothetical protein